MKLYENRKCKKSGERTATKVLLILLLMLSICCVIAGISLLGVYGSYAKNYTKPLSKQAKRILNSYLIPGIVCFVVGLFWIPLEVVSLKAMYVSNKFSLMVGLAIPHVIIGVGIPAAVMMVLVALLECKKTKSSL